MGLREGFKNPRTGKDAVFGDNIYDFPPYPSVPPLSFFVNFLASHFLLWPGRVVYSLSRISP